MDSVLFGILIAGFLMLVAAFVLGLFWVVRLLMTPETDTTATNTNPSIWDLVIADMGARDRLGWDNCGKPLRGHNGRDMLRDAYEEALDLACYLRGAIWERDNPKVPRT